jgi:hypothetical protein
MSLINQAWLEGRPRDLTPYFDPKIAWPTSGSLLEQGRELGRQRRRDGRQR